MEILKIIIKEMNREKVSKEKQRKAMEKERAKWLKEINAQATQPTLKPVEDPIKLEKLKNFLRKELVA